MVEQVASLLSPHAPTTPKAASQDAVALEHAGEEYEAGEDSKELQTALSSLNEATFETAQVRRFKSCDAQTDFILSWAMLIGCHSCLHALRVAGQTRQLVEFLAGAHLRRPL
jgi:hypothetical protein